MYYRGILALYIYNAIAGQLYSTGSLHMALPCAWGLMLQGNKVLTTAPVFPQKKMSNVRIGFHLTAYFLQFNLFSSQAAGKMSSMLT